MADVVVALALTIGLTDKLYVEYDDDRDCVKVERGQEWNVEPKIANDKTDPEANEEVESVVVKTIGDIKFAVIQNLEEKTIIERQRDCERDYTNGIFAKKKSTMLALLHDVLEESVSVLRAKTEKDLRIEVSKALTKEQVITWCTDTLKPGNINVLENKAKGWKQILALNRAIRAGARKKAEEAAGLTADLATLKMARNKLLEGTGLDETKPLEMGEGGGEPFYAPGNTQTSPLCTGTETMQNAEHPIPTLKGAKPLADYRVAPGTIDPRVGDATSGVLSQNAALFVVGVASYLQTTGDMPDVVKATAAGCAECTTKYTIGATGYFVGIAGAAGLASSLPMFTFESLALSERGFWGDNRPNDLIIADADTKTPDKLIDDRVCEEAQGFLDDLQPRSRISWTGGGQGYTYTTTGTRASESTYTVSYEISESINGGFGGSIGRRLLKASRRAGDKVKAEVKGEFGGGVGETGYDLTMGTGQAYSLSKEENSGMEDTVQVAYTLCDPQVGDEFVTEVGMDPVYGTPVFSTVLGKTSCNWEFDTSTLTAPREKFSIGVYPGVLLHCGGGDLNTPYPAPGTLAYPDGCGQARRRTRSFEHLNTLGTWNGAACHSDV